MTTEVTRRSELAQLVTYHVLRYIYRDELVPVVHIVCPTKSGEIMLARDQVLMTDFLPPSFWAITLASSLGSMYGPFFNDRLIMLLFLDYFFLLDTMNFEVVFFGSRVL